MGLIIGVGANTPKFPYDYYYGVTFDTATASTACTRVGRPELHVSLPIQSRMRRCLLNDAGKVVTYLGAQDSTKTDTGAAADLTGASGQVMVEIPEHFRKIEVNGTEVTVLISEHNLPGFNKIPKCYRSAYQATVDRTNSKLASVVNTSEQYRGGNNSAATDETAKEQRGMAATAISLTTFRTYARNRGTAGKDGKGWNCDVYAIQKACFWLYVIEYANLNSQLPFKAQPDASGYKQGGLGYGVSTADSTKWSAMNGYYPFVPCGVTNSLGNATGVVNYTLNELQAAAYGEAKTFSVPSYRGIENPFGHIWHFTDGCKCKIQADGDGGKSLFYSAEFNPASFNSSGYEGYILRGELPRGSGYVKELMIGEHGENMPKTTGASSSTYVGDYFYTDIPASGEAERAVFVGSYAANGTSAGLTCADTDSTASTTTAHIGSRLCFIPA